MALDDPLAFGIVDAKGRDGDAAIIDQAGNSCDTDQASPGASADHGTETGGLEIERETIATGAAPTIDEHGLGALVSDPGPGPIFAITHAPIVDHFPPEHFDESIGNLTAAVETFVNNQPWFFELRAKLPHEFGLAVTAGIGHIDVTDFAAAGAVHALAIFLNPCQVPQPRFAGHGLDQHVMAIFHGGLAVDREEHRLIGHALKSGIGFDFRIE